MCLLLVFLAVNRGCYFQVSSSFTCLRRAVLDERIRCNERSSTAVIGILLHQLFQVIFDTMFSFLHDRRFSH